MAINPKRQGDSRGAEMKKYDPDSECCKCGYSLVDSRFGQTLEGGQVIQRTCKRCGFQWSELPQDADA